MALTAKKVYAILKRQISDMEAKLNSPVRYRGTVATADLLPLNPDIGDMYNIESKSIYGEAGMNVAWNGVVWDTMGAPIDMSLYLTKEEAEAVIQRLVTEYFEKNPVKPGATTEQAQQIEQNKTDIASLKTETSSLKEDLSTKITKFYASSQGETHLADSDNGKIMDMMLYGKSEQKQYSGKNLTDFVIETVTRNGITCTNNGDGTYTLNGTSEGDSFFTSSNDFVFEQNKKYKIIGCPKGGSISTYRLDGSLNVNSDVGNGVTYTGDGNSRSIRIIVFKGVTANNLLFKPMIVDAEKYPDITYDDFEPYTGGIPSPNPDYPQEIKSVVNPTVKVCGKNLLNATLESTTKNGVTCTNNGDGTYTLNGTATSDIQLVVGYHNILDGQVKMLGCPSGGSAKTYCVIMQFSSGIAGGEKGRIYDIGNGGVGSASVFIESGANYIRGIISIMSGTTCNNLLFKPMLTTDLTATYDDFEPYHEQTVTLPYTLNAIPVSSGGNVTINGQQYIADYVDVERGKLVRMVDDVEAKNYTWDLYPNGNNIPRRFGMNDTIRFNMPADIRIMSSYFKQIATNTRTDLSTWFQTYYIAITDMNEKWKNSEALIQWFSENNVHFYLPLKTPTEIDLTPEEIAAFKALATYYPTTNISVNSEQLDGYTVFNYPINMANGWNYVKQQIGDTREYIYDIDARTQDTDLQAAEAYVNSEYAVALTELEV